MTIRAESAWSTFWSLVETVRQLRIVTYGRVKKLLPGSSGLAESPPAAGEERRAVQHTLNTTVEDAIRHMRTAMRLDLGVAAEPGGASDQ